MGTTPGLMTIEQYLHTAYRPDVDFVHGEIQQRNLGEFEQGHLSTFARGVLSPEHAARAQRVLADYRTMEVQNTWPVDPVRGVAYIMTATACTSRLATPDIWLHRDRSRDGRSV